jgi:hypothetical protein
MYSSCHCFLLGGFLQTLLSISMLLRRTETQRQSTNVALASEMLFLVVLVGGACAPGTPT